MSVCHKSDSSTLYIGEDQGNGPLLIFGETDGLLKLGWLERLGCIFPRHRSIVMQACHHFPQEYDPAAIVTAIQRWCDEAIEP